MACTKIYILMHEKMRKKFIACCLMDLITNLCWDITRLQSFEEGGVTHDVTRDLGLNSLIQKKFQSPLTRDSQTTLILRNPWNTHCPSLLSTRNRIQYTALSSQDTLVYPHPDKDVQSQQSGTPSHTDSCILRESWHSAGWSSTGECPKYIHPHL